MKIKSQLVTLLALCSVLFAACDDDVDTTGSSVLPGGNDMGISLDTAYLKVKTVSMDSIYARTIEGVLGKYEDEVFGTVKSDYLCEFYCPDDMSFQPNVVSIDSMQLSLDFITYRGDTVTPMGLSVYEVNKELGRNFYTNVDPSDFCNLKQPLGQKTYSISQSSKYAASSTVLVRTVSVNLKDELAQKFYKESLKSNNAFQNSATFKKFFPGVYVTTTFGSGSLINVNNTSMNIYYKYNDVKGNHDNTADTIRTSLFSIAVTPEVIQMNHIENKLPSSLFEANTGAVYMKSPAGVCLELELPIKSIIDKAGDKVVNSAKFSLYGYSEKEAELKDDLGRPQYVLLVNKDSLNNFFLRKSLPNSITSYSAEWSSSTNSYVFSNIAQMIVEYKKQNIKANPTFMVIPVKQNYTTNVYNQTELSSVNNYMQPSSSIIRSDKQFMNISLIYSDYK